MDRSEKILIPGILLSIVLSFTVFFFSPLDIYLGNMKDFTTSVQDIIMPLTCMAAVSFAVFMLIFTLLFKINTKLYNVVLCLVFGIFLSFYCQMMFMNGGMQSIAGGKNLYSGLNIKFRLNFLIDVIIAFIPLTLWLIREKKPNIKFLNIGSGKIIIYVCTITFFMQLSGTASMIIRSKAFDAPEEEHGITYLSYHPTMSLSKDENIIVFLADRLDGDWLDESIEKYPDIPEIFDGFTYYRNNVSCYTNTFPSVCEMLTGCKFNGEDWDAYLKKAWSREQVTLPDRLNASGYSVNLLIDNVNSYKQKEDLVGRCQNLYYREVTPSTNYFGKNGIADIMFKLSMGKLMPYILKDIFIGNIESDFANNFKYMEERIPDMQDDMIGVGSDLYYYEFLKQVGLTDDSPNKTFSFIHLHFSHEPQVYLSKLYDENITDENCDIHTTIRGSCVILQEYFDQLKKLGLYDKSTIIVLGDHGRAPYEIQGWDDFKRVPLKKQTRLNTPIVTSLLIKPAGAASAPLKTDSESELSTADFYASILQYAGIDHKDSGTSYLDIIENGMHPDRYMHVFDWHRYGNITHVVDYKINGDAHKMENWKAE